MDKNIEKVFSPVSNVIKKNSKIINLALVILVCLMVFPTEYFLTIDPVKEIEGEVNWLTKKELDKLELYFNHKQIQKFQKLIES